MVENLWAAGGFPRALPFAGRTGAPLEHAIEDCHPLSTEVAAGANDRLSLCKTPLALNSRSTDDGGIGRPHFGASNPIRDDTRECAVARDADKVVADRRIQLDSPGVR